MSFQGPGQGHWALEAGGSSPGREEGGLLCGAVMARAALVPRGGRLGHPLPPPTFSDLSTPCPSETSPLCQLMPYPRMPSLWVFYPIPTCLGSFNSPGVPLLWCPPWGLTCPRSHHALNIHTYFLHFSSLGFKSWAWHRVGVDKCL